MYQVEFDHSIALRLSLLQVKNKGYHRSINHALFTDVLPAARAVLFWLG
jgi:hypothetical protein